VKGPAEPEILLDMAERGTRAVEWWREKGAHVALVAALVFTNTMTPGGTGTVKLLHAQGHFGDGSVREFVRSTIDARDHELLAPAHRRAASSVTVVFWRPQPLTSGII
jgi:hypothetical protein